MVIGCCFHIFLHYLCSQLGCLGLWLPQLELAARGKW